MPRKICKFGGTSVENAEAIKRVCSIVRSDTDRTAIVVSAPAGVTTTLVTWTTSSAEDKDSILRDVEHRFTRIASELAIEPRMDASIESMIEDIRQDADVFRERRLGHDLYHYLISRGEYINAKIVAAALGFEFVDAESLMRFRADGTFSMRLTRAAAREIKLRQRAQRGIVVPGFYGRVEKGPIRTFSRGGSDITGAILAVLLKTEGCEYENWTDVEGVMSADPRIVTNVQKRDIMTYRELRELSFMGAKMFHEDAVKFVRDAGIPIHLRSSRTPEKSGTMIIETYPDKPPYFVTGVAGKNGFSIVTVTRYGLDDTKGIVGRLGRLFARLGVSINPSPGIDSLSFIVATEELVPVQEKLVNILTGRGYRLDVRIEHGMALICTVGEGMRGKVGTSRMVDGALAGAGINIRLQSQSATEHNIMRLVESADQESAVRAIHYHLIG